MSDAGRAPRATRARAAAGDELEVMAAVEAVAGAQTGWPLGLVVVELRRELERQALSGGAVHGAALVELAREVLLRARRDG